MKKKKVLILSWNSVNDNTAIIDYFTSKGMVCSMIDLNGQDCRDESHAEFIDDYISKNSFDLAYSTNYFNYLAYACHEHGIPYISWSYDSPSHLDTVEHLRYDTSHIFLFDSYEVERFRDRYDLNNFHYLPLAADIGRFEKAIDSKYDIEKYKAEISFVGSLYESDINKYLNLLSDYRKGQFNAVVDYCTGLYDECVLETLNMRDYFYWEEEKEFNACVKKDPKAGPLSESEEIDSKISSRIGRLAVDSISNRERLILISMLSNHWQFKLYSTSSHEVFKTTIECGTASYYTDMPRVFKNSKINLNITKKSIKAGIPLRCIDIMGCGGFLLANYQKDFENDFKDGESLALYRSFDEAFDKCKFYLSHEEERQKVARKGNEIIKNRYTYKMLLDRAIEMAGLNHLLKYTP